MSHAARAESAYRGGRFAEALALANADLARGDSQSLRWKVLSLFRLGRGEEAEDLLGEILVAGPDEAFMEEVAAAMAGNDGGPSEGPADRSS